MKKTILVICLFSFTCYTYAQDPMFFESFVPSPATYAYGAGGYKLPSEGSLHILMIFAEFPDDSYDVSNSRWVKGQAPLNMNNWVDPSWSTSPTQGSLTHYFNDMSNNKLKVTGKEIHFITSYSRDEYLAIYSGTPAQQRRGKIQKDIIQEIDINEDFSNYDNWDLVSDYESNLSLDFIRMDSLISTSVQGSSSKFLFQYNGNNKITEWLLLDNFSSEWNNSIKNDLFYDNQNNLITEINLGWSTNHWDSLSRINYSYEMGKLSQRVFQNYNNNSWDNLTRANFVYDTNQNLSNTLNESWINNDWQNWFLVTNYYSLQNSRDSILFQTWVNNDWQNERKTIFYYSENQIDLDSLIVSSWNGLSWIKFLKREIVNDANHNQIAQIDKVWNANSWLNEIRRIYTYNEFNFIENAYCEIWYNNQWISGDGDILFQYANDFTVTIITNNISAYYSNIVSVDENENLVVNDFSLSQNFPNPFNPSTLIEYKIPKSTFVEIVVYDILGKEIATLVEEYKSKGIHKIQFNSNNLPSGVYIYRIKAGNYSETKKMILMR